MLGEMTRLHIKESELIKTTPELSAQAPVSGFGPENARNYLWSKYPYIGCTTIAPTALSRVFFPLWACGQNSSWELLRNRAHFVCERKKTFIGD